MILSCKEVASRHSLQPWAQWVLGRQDLSLMNVLVTFLHYNKIPDRDSLREERCCPMASEGSVHGHLAPDAWVELYECPERSLWPGKTVL